MAVFNQGISIDGTSFDVPITTLDESADFLYKYAERTEDGVMHSELIGVYINHSMKFGKMDADTNTALWDKLKEPVTYHSVTVPSGQGTYTFDAYLSSVKRSAYWIKETETQYDVITCKFKAMIPAATP